MEIEPSLSRLQEPTLAPVMKQLNLSTSNLLFLSVPF
jgi:hypothetical protein